LLILSPAYEAVYSYANALHTFLGDIRNDHDKPLFFDYLKSSVAPGTTADTVQCDANGNRVSTLAIMNYNYTAGALSIAISSLITVW